MAEEQRGLPAAIITPEILDDGDESILPILRKMLPPDERKDIIRELTLKTILLSDRLGIAQAEMLWEIKNEEYWKEWKFEDSNGVSRSYASWAEYCEREISFSLRKADYAVKIYDVCVFQLGVPVEKMKNMQWSKVKEVIEFLTPDNWEEMLTQIESMTTKEVEEMAKNLRKHLRNDAGGDDTPDQRMSFVFTKEQKEIVEQALGMAKDITDSQVPSHNLEVICTDFLVSNPDEGDRDISLNMLIRSIERTYGKKLVVQTPEVRVVKDEE